MSDLTLEQFLAFASSGLCAGLVVGLVKYAVLKSIRSVFRYGIQALKE